LTPRAVRVRNAWLRHFAGLHQLPGPRTSEFAHLGTTLSLREAAAEWSKRAAAAQGLALQRARTRSRHALAGALAAALLFLTVMPTRANVVATTGWPPATRAWVSVTDSLVAAVNAKLLRLGQSEARFTMPLSSAELAALVLGARPVMRISVLESIEARADSALQIRGFLPGGGRMVMRGDVRVSRRGTGEFRLWQVSLNGISIPVAQYSGPPSGGTDREVDAPRFRFDLPRFVRAIRVTGGRAFVVPESSGR
jgi:hypothetical protein